jgi:DNA polymerase
MILHLDFETRSASDISEVGSYNYATHPTTAILMLAYAYDDGVAELWQPHEGEMPSNLVEALKDTSIIKESWHASFERDILMHQCGIWIPYELWKDPMINARYMSMPGGLDAVGKILGLESALQKDDRGKELKTLFTVPLPTKRGRKKATDENTLFDISPIGPEKIEYVFADHKSHPEEWEQFCQYCRQDIVAERELGKRMAHFPLPEREMRVWYLDQKINDAGMPTNREFVKRALQLAQNDKDKLIKNLKELTGLQNPNSNPRMLQWVRSQGYPYNSLRKEPVNVALADPEVKITDLGRTVLQIRQKASKTSYKKLNAILPALCGDDRLRDQFLFLGSPRAGRWSGQAVQLHNLARPIKAMEEDGALDKALQLIWATDSEGIEREFLWKDKKTGEEHPGSVIDIVTSCIRSAFQATDGNRFNVSDLNAIENRVLGWVSGEDKILEVFRKNRDPYLSFASLMYKIPYEVLAATKKSPDTKEKRQVGKPAVLGAGYRLSGGEWKTNRYGDRVKSGLWGYAENMGVIITEKEAHDSVKVFRSEYEKVVQFWYDCENAVIRCLKQGGCQMMGPTGLVWCDRKKRKDKTFVLRIHLPSGRYLHYLNAHIQTVERQGRNGPYEKEQMAYDGMNQETKQWESILTHGGKLTENIVQAISRDVLADAMVLADDLGFEIVGHVHDEIVTMSHDSEESLGLVDLRWCMMQTPAWAPGLPLSAEGYEGRTYRKG